MGTVNLAATGTPDLLRPNVPNVPPSTGLAAMDSLVASQARFRVLGTGPVSQRKIEPATVTAAQLLTKTPQAADAVRGVLQLVEHVAGGPAESANVRFNGVAFSTSQDALAANTWRANLDSDDEFTTRLTKLPRKHQTGVLEELARRKATETAGMLANVTSGWMNVGPVASTALLAKAGVPGTPVSMQQLADAVRVLLHESVHVVDDEPANLPMQAMHGVWESLAEARVVTLPQLQAARTKLGLDAVVPDAALQQSLLHRPYAHAERALTDVLRSAGIEPGSTDEREVMSATAHDAVDLLTSKLAARAGVSSDDARSVIATVFAEAMPGSR